MGLFKRKEATPAGANGTNGTTVESKKGMFNMDSGDFNRVRTTLDDEVY